VVALGRNRLVVLAVSASLIVIVVSAYLYFSSQQRYLREEFIGGKYQCRIGILEEDYRGFEVGRVFYVKEDVEQHGFYNEYLRESLEWVRANTLEDSVVFNWWDYGHMVTGIGERESVIKNPSEEALVSVGDPSGLYEFEPHEKLVDVAKAFSTTNKSETFTLMEKYGANHLLLTVEDGVGKVVWIFRFAGLNFSDYMNTSWQSTGLPFDPDQYNELDKTTMVFKVLSNAEIPGLKQVYSDENVRVYKRED